jgi:hypothetical protein
LLEHTQPVELTLSLGIVRHRGTTGELIMPSLIMVLWLNIALLLITNTKKKWIIIIIIIITVLRLNILLLLIITTKLSIMLSQIIVLWQNSKPLPSIALITLLVEI